MVRSGSGPPGRQQRIAKQAKQAKTLSNSTPNSPVTASKHISRPVSASPMKSANDPIKSPMPALNLQSTTPRGKPRLDIEIVNNGRRRSSAFQDGISLPSPKMRRDSGGTGPSPMINPRDVASPSLQPRLDGASPNIAAELTAKSNYQAILEGKHRSLGLNFSTDLPDALTQRRSTHKEAEQKRRDGLKAWFDALKKGSTRPVSFAR